MANKLPHVIVCMGERENGQWFAYSANAVCGDSPLHAVVKYSDQEYAPIGELEAEQRRATGLAEVARAVVDHRDSCVMCDHSETRKRELEMYRAIDRLESLLTEKPADAK